MALKQMLTVKDAVHITRLTVFLTLFPSFQLLFCASQSHTHLKANQKINSLQPVNNQKRTLAFRLLNTGLRKTASLNVQPVPWRWWLKMSVFSQVACLHWVSGHKNSWMRAAVIKKEKIPSFHFQKSSLEINKWTRPVIAFSLPHILRNRNSAAKLLLCALPQGKCQGKMCDNHASFLTPSQQWREKPPWRRSIHQQTQTKLRVSTCCSCEQRCQPWTLPLVPRLLQTTRAAPEIALMKVQRIRFQHDTVTGIGPTVRQ